MKLNTIVQPHFSGMNIQVKSVEKLAPTSFEELATIPDTYERLKTRIGKLDDVDFDVEIHPAGTTATIDFDRRDSKGMSRKRMEREKDQTLPEFLDTILTFAELFKKAK